MSILINDLNLDSQNWIWDPNVQDTDVLIDNNRHEPKVCFFPKMSTGTIGIRVSKILNNGLYYCEFKTSKRLYGSSVMFGLSTVHAKLKCNQYIDLLGNNIHSWGLSHRGHIYQNYKRIKFMKPLPENKQAIIGMLFNGLLGTLSYFHNGQYLGVAFTGLNTISHNLYPTITSTASGVKISIVKCMQGFFTLEHLCYNLILKSVRSKEDVSELFLPHLLNQTLIELLKLLKS